LKDWKSKPKDGQKRDDKSKVICYNCDKPGHIAKECRQEGGGAHRKFKHKGKGKRAAEKQESRSKDYIEECAYSATIAAPAFKSSGGGTEVRFLDSAASRHFEPNRNNFISLRSCDPYIIEVADGRHEKATEVGDIRFEVGEGEARRIIRLSDVYYTPWMSNSLISLSQLRKSGVSFSNNEDKYGVLTDVNKGKEILRVKMIHNMYPVVSWKPGSAHAATSKSQPLLTVMEAHARLGHIAPSAIRQLVKEGMVTGLNVDLNSPDEDCEACIRGKFTRVAIPKSHPTPRSSAPWDIVWSDVWGPPSTTAKGGYRYYISFTDDYSRHTHLYLMKTKSEAFDCYCTFAAMVRTQFGKEIRALHSDRGGEFTSDVFTQYLKDHGTRRSLTAHDTPEMNGVAERLNYTIANHSRAMIDASGLPKSTWGHAVQYAVWTKNRSPTKALEKEKKTPFEMLFGVKPDLMSARGFGCRVFVRSKAKSKLDARATIARWIGPDPSTKGGHKVYWSDTGRVTIERDIRFVDGTVFMGEIDNSVVTTIVPLQTDARSQQEAVVKHAPESIAQQRHPEPSTKPSFQTPRIDSPAVTATFTGADSDPLDGLDDGNEPEPTGRPQRLRKPTAYVRQLMEHGDPIPRGIQLPTGGNPYNTSSKALNTTPDPIPVVNENLRDGRGLGNGAIAHGYAMMVSPDYQLPRTRAQALASDKRSKWLDAEVQENEKLKKQHTFDLVPRSEAKSAPIPVQWVYDTKRDGDGNIIEFKARLVARGDKQQRFIDFVETHSSVLKSTTKNILLAVAARKGWYIRQGDFKSAFLNAPLDEEIYVEQPPGYEDSSGDFVCRLNKALYGLRQASRAWYKTISEYLLSLEFTRSECDHALFYRHKGGNHLFLGLHVDDNLTIGNNLDECIELERKLNEKFPLKIMGDMEHYLGTTVKRDWKAGTISLGQVNYIDGLVALCNLEDAHPVLTPLPLGVKLSNEYCPELEEEMENMRKVPYREVIGGLMYIANGTRPDISYATNVLAQAASNPSQVHWQAAKHLVRYLKGTRNYRLTYGTSSGMFAYSDASHASEELRWKSMSGYTFMINGGAVSWSAKKQPIVALSTAESEYIAMTHAAKDIIWIHSFLSEVFRPLSSPITLLGDNQSAIAMAKNDTFHPRTKHIAIRYHFIRHCVANNQLQVSWINSQSNCADIFTKALDKTKTSVLAQGLGLLKA
jgi:hypothetical protein